MPMQRELQSTVRFRQVRPIPLHLLVCCLLREMTPDNVVHRRSPPDPETELSGTSSENAHQISACDSVVDPEPERYEFVGFRLPAGYQESPRIETTRGDRSPL